MQRKKIFNFIDNNTYFWYNLISSIKNYPDITQEYEQFINNYLTYENGNATDKILEKIGIKN